VVGLRLSCVWLQLSLVLLVVAGDSHEEEEGSEEEEEEEEQHQLFGSYSHYGSRRLRQNSNPGGGCVVDIGMIKSSLVDYGGSCDHGDVSSACIGQTDCCCCCPQPWAITTHDDDYVALLLLLLLLVVHQSMTSSSLQL